MNKNSIWAIGALTMVVAGCAGPQGQEPLRVSAGVKKKQGLLSELKDAENEPPVPDGPQGQRGPGVPPFWVRPGYRVTLVASKIPNCRFMQFDDQGNLYVSHPGPGKITFHTLGPDGQYHYKADFVTGCKDVHTMYWRKGWLWFGQRSGVSRARCTDGTGIANDVVDVLPRNSVPFGGHFWRPVLVDDSGFYTEIGDSGNVNDEMDSDRQKIWHYDLDGGHKRLFAAGLRNTEKLLFRPGTSEVWGMDHGSDWYGKAFGDRDGNQPITDDIPGEKFNHYVQGGFYGHPYFVAGRFPRPEYGNRPDLVDWANKVVEPAMSFGAHWAPNGWCFYTGDAIPGAKGDAFMSFHGSWNRKHKQGYRIERCLFDPVTQKPFGHYMIVGTLDNQEKVLARPTDVVQAPDGTLLFSDDQFGSVYRIEAIR